MDSSFRLHDWHMGCSSAVLKVFQSCLEIDSRGLYEAVFSEAVLDMAVALQLVPWLRDVYSMQKYWKLGARRQQHSQAHSHFSWVLAGVVVLVVVVGSSSCHHSLAAAGILEVGGVSVSPNLAFSTMPRKSFAGLRQHHHLPAFVLLKLKMPRKHWA